MKGDGLFPLENHVQDRPGIVYPVDPVEHELQDPGARDFTNVNMILKNRQNFFI